MEQKEKGEGRRRVAIALAIVVLFPTLLYAIWHFSSPKYYVTGPYERTDVLLSSNGKLVASALVSDTAQKREKGLMGRTINETEGMLLVFDTSGKYSITMRDMEMSIDMVFINSKKSIVHIEKDVPPMSPDPSSWGSRSPDSDCIYILELFAGRAASLSLSNRMALNFTI